jgi:hypothetical protein
VRCKCKDGIIGEELTDTGDANPDSATIPPPTVTFEDTAHLQDQLAEAELFLDGEGHWDYEAEEEADRKRQTQSDLHSQHEEIRAEIEAEEAHTAVEHPDRTDHPPPHRQLQNELRQSEEDGNFERAEKVALSLSSSISSSSAPLPSPAAVDLVETKIDDSHAAAITFLPDLHLAGKLEAPHQSRPPAEAASRLISTPPVEKLQAPPQPHPPTETGPRKESVVRRKQKEAEQRQAARKDGRYLHQHKVFATPAEERQYLSDHLDHLWRACGADPSTLQEAKDKWIRPASPSEDQKKTK